MHINDGFEEACLLIEACRVSAKAASMRIDSRATPMGDEVGMEVMTDDGCLMTDDGCLMTDDGCLMTDD